MRTLIISSLLLIAGACDRDTIRDGAGTARDRVGGPTDLSTRGQPVAPSGTFGTGDSSERAKDLPGTADTGGMRETTGFATSGPMGTGGPGYTTGTTGVGGNQGIPTTQPNPDVGRTDTKDLDKRMGMGATHHTDVGRAEATARVQATEGGEPRAMNDMTGKATDNIGPSDNPREGANDTPGIDGGNSSSAGTGATTSPGDTGSERGAVTAQNTKKKPAKQRPRPVQQ